MTNITKPAHIIVGLSGGVDSAVAAYLLKKAGHKVEALFMKNWEEDDTNTYCAAEVDKNDAAEVCDVLNIPLQVINFAEQYWQKVFTYFLDEYRTGRTPNPDILCNKEIKFSAFLNYAKQLGADYIATGHYVRTQWVEEQLQLLKGIDLQKDQSYFLHALSQHQLKASIFPLGIYPKTRVREIAKEIKLPNFNKKDSTGICFIGERKFKNFLNDFLPAQPGPITTLTGEVLGVHQGLMFYTIGQRQGLQIGGLKNKGAAPWYVAKKDLARNTLIVVQGEHAALYQHTLKATQVHWINTEPQLPLRCFAKTRYRQNDQACMIEKINREEFQLTFDHSQRAITPGQFVVFYDHDICLGGGIIK